MRKFEDLSPQEQQARLKARERAKAYYHAHPEKRKKWARAYYLKHHEELRAKQNERYRTDAEFRERKKTLQRELYRNSEEVRKYHHDYMLWYRQNIKRQPTNK